jgi:hypothetical protein
MKKEVYHRMVKDFAQIEAQRLLADVHSDFVFRMKDGSQIKNLKELYSALQYAGPELFSHHVNSERNDFGNWIKDVHKDYKLANRLFSSSTKEECAKAVRDRISEIESSMSPKESVLLLPPPQEVSPQTLLEERLLEQDPKAQVSSIFKEIEELSRADLDPAVQAAAYKKPLMSGFVSSLKELSVVFDASSWKGFAADMKSMVSSGKGFAKDIKAKAADDTKKDVMLSHLKKVYR